MNTELIDCLKVVLKSSFEQDENIYSIVYYVGVNYPEYSFAERIGELEHNNVIMILDSSIKTMSNPHTYDHITSHMIIYEVVSEEGIHIASFNNL